MADVWTRGEYADDFDMPEELGWTFVAITSKQESILANVVATLQGINGAGDYNVDLGSRVYRKFKSPFKQPKSHFPYAVVLDHNDLRFSPKTANEYTTGDNILSVTNAWTVTILIFDKLEEDKELEGLIQKRNIELFSDVAIAMHVDTTRGGNALSTVLLSMAKEQSEEDRVGAVGIDFAIKYDLNPSESVT